MSQTVSPITVILEGLNPQQRKAVEAKDGPTLIIAGPGSGKTRVLTARVAYLILARNVFPYRIMAVTFTNKAAREMRDRLTRMVGSAADEVAMGTFHSICARMLRRDAVHAGLDHNFVIYDTDDQIAVVKAALAAMNLDEKKYKPASIHAKISNAKNELIAPEDYKPESYLDEIVGRVYAEYNKTLRANNAVDFDDLLMESVKLLRNNAAVRERMQERYAHVLVDEFQDTNIAQYELVKLIAGKHHNLMGVGDPDQCLVKGSRILTPRGAKAIEKIKEGEAVIAASGRGESMSANVSRIMSREYHGDIIRVVTQRGHRLDLTPNHVVFARLGVSEKIHYVYLMQRKNLGFRVGIVKGARSDGESPDLQLGIKVRSNQEVADKIWILKVCETREEALYWEAYFAFQYGLPTAVFHVRGRRMRMTQEHINRLYQTIPTKERAEKLFEDLQFDQRYPHYIPKGKLRNVVNLRYFGDQRRSEVTPWNAHRVSVCSGSPELKETLAQLGHHPRKGKRKTWRVEFSRIHFADAMVIADQLSKQGDLELIPGAFLVPTDNAALPARKFGLMPASHLHPSMIMAVEHEGSIITDEIVSIERVPYRGNVYDLNVDELHNYVAGGIVVHNSIYKWRGADYRNVARLQEDFRDLQIIALEQNYRSTQTILDAAMAVIKRNPNRKHINLFTERGSGPKIVVREMFNEDEEAQYVIDTIREVLKQKAAQPGEIAIMYRTNAQSRAMEDAFVRAGMAYKLVGATRFYARKEIKDVLAYLRIVNNPADFVSLKRVINTPTRGIGEGGFAALEQASRAARVPPLEAIKRGLVQGRAAKPLAEFGAIWEKWVALRDDVSVGQLFDQIVKTSGYREFCKDGTDEGEDRWANVMELRNVAAGAGDAPLSDFLNDVALVSETDNYEESAAAPTLLTLHAAKGLEFRVVFIVGLLDGVLPHSRTLDNPEEIAEERRLFYVGITRAKERLYLLRSFRRGQWGQSDVFEPSRFLRDLPNTLVDGNLKKNSEIQRDVTRWDAPTPAPARPAAASLQTGAKFKPGDRVTHARFGGGIVIRSMVVRDDEEVDVFFEGVGAKKLSAMLSGLKKA